MPGVNVPWSQVLYYLITLTISGVFHEFGHAISAVRYVDYFSIAIEASLMTEDCYITKLRDAQISNTVNLRSGSVENP